MKALKFSSWIILSLFILIFIACGGGGSSDGVGTGTLSVGLTDSSTARYLAVYVTIDEVQVNKNDGSSSSNSGWETVATPKKTYNLLKLVNGLTEVLGEEELEAGTYRQIRLVVGKTAESENNINGVPHPYANYVVLTDDSYIELKIPSGYQTGVKLVHNFTVEKDSFVELVLDFEACRSVVETGSGKYILKPTIKVIETENKFQVHGTVKEQGTDIPITGALVSAQISEGLSASVVRSTLTSAAVGKEGRYSLLLSPRQTYNMVVYSDIKVGGQLYLPVCAEITVPMNSDLQQDFTLEKSNIGTINGVVSFSGNIDSSNQPVVYLSFYSTLDCGENYYVEVTTLPVSPDPVSHNISYSVDLPLGTYDVVASSDGFDAQTIAAVGLTSDEPVFNSVDFEF